MNTYEDVDSLKGLKYFIYKDFKSVNNSKKVHKMLYTILFQPGFKYVFWMRLTRYFWLKRAIWYKIPYIICCFILKHFAYKYQFDISHRAKIGAGFIIGHHGYIVIASSVVMGEHCFVRSGVVIGKKGGYNSQTPLIGNDVNIGTGAKIIGGVNIGNNVIIGANAVVTHDIPNNSVAVGIPAKVIKSCETMMQA